MSAQESIDLAARLLFAADGDPLDDTLQHVLTDDGNPHVADPDPAAGPDTRAE